MSTPKLLPSTSGDKCRHCGYVAERSEIGGNHWVTCPGCLRPMDDDGDGSEAVRDEAGEE